MDRGALEAPAARWRFAAQIRENFFERREALRVYEFEEAEFEMQARIGLAAQVVVGGEKDLEESREIFFRETSGLLGETGAFVGRCGDEIGIGAADASDKQIPEMANRFAAEVLEVLPVGNEAMDEAESALGGLSGDRFDEFVENAFGDDAEKFADLRVGDFVAGVCDGLLEKREAVAKAAFGGAGKNGDGAGIDFEIFGFGNALDFAGNFFERERAEIEKLRPRFNRVDKIFRASGGEDEDDAFGRLFEGLQQERSMLRR